MIQAVRDYLLQHKSVSIPGLGTIYVERIPAQSDFVNRQLLPPAYHLRFDKYFDAPPKEFFAFLAAKNNVQDYEAIRQYNEWAQELRNGLGAEQTIRLEAIGSLKRDGSGDIVFEPVSAIKTYDIPIPAERIVRTNARHTMIVGDRETNTVEMSDYLQVVHKEKASWWLYALIIAAIALVLIFFHYYRYGADTPFGNHQRIDTK